MKYKVAFEGNVETVFECERSFLVRCVRNFGCAETHLDEMVREVGEEISSHLYGEFEDRCYTKPDEEFIAEMSYEGEGDWTVTLRGWITDTITLTTGAPIAERLRNAIGAVLLAEFHTPAESKKQPIEAAA